MHIIVPYRNRPDHLTAFIKHMSAYLPGADIVVVEQADNKPFNRAKLLNVGFLETNPDFFCAHDVDHLPLSLDYSPKIGVTQLASSQIQLHGFLGGVTMFDNKTFRKVGGYDNDFFHRAEDNSLMFNLSRLGIPVINRFGVFDLQPHPRSGPEFIPALWAKARRLRMIQDQLSICQYQITDRIETDYLHLKVKL